MAKKKRLLWQLFFSYIVITLLSLLAVTWYASNSLSYFFLRQTGTDLKARALIFEEQLLDLNVPLNEEGIDSLCKRVGKSTSTRFTVILPWGKVIGDSDEDPEKMDNHIDRPEIVEALNSGFGASSRESPTLQKKMMYVAILFKKEGRTLAVVRSSIPIDSIDAALRTIQLEIVLAGLLIAILAAILSLMYSHRIRRPIKEMRSGVESFAHGDFQHRLPVSELEDMGGLAETMNQMAAELQTQISTVTEQRNELEAVFSSMVEGVIAVDLEERIISMNQAAAGIFGCKTQDVQGRTIQETIRNPNLQRLVSETLSSEQPVQKDIIFYSTGEIILNGLGTVLRDSMGTKVGGLVVLNDVTRLRKLENIRKDFVANVSHEIKTPITAIKGFVETLLDGAAKNAEDADRFLAIIQKHVGRLEAIVEDLLSLSRIEEEAEKEEISLDEHPIKEVLNAAIQVCQVKSDPKNIGLNLACRDDLKGKINPALLEQALVNLIDNAVKYSEPGKDVNVETEERDGEMLIHVQDQGCGIERRHLDRLFERFYRVDKARSRTLGGTGLGLAIVKHIMLAHGGRVSVKSQPGVGSTFTLHLPPMAGSQS
jgi:two-component system, OmpR family, phosphate regulon sensor histidine kinase PhoR